MQRQQGDGGAAAASGGAPAAPRGWKRLGTAPVSTLRVAFWPPEP